MSEPQQVFEAAIAELDAQQLRRRRRVVAPAGGAMVDADGRRLLAFASNDYLGLAQHPALIDAAQRAAARYDAEAAYVMALAAGERARLSRKTATDADSLLRLARLRRHHPLRVRLRPQVPRRSRPPWFRAVSRGQRLPGR
jgi:7-keto-8-aminopelargonate synthetase-like enzyme